jgi:hypothetical protein
MALTTSFLALRVFPGDLGEEACDKKENAEKIECELLPEIQEYADKVEEITGMPSPFPIQFIIRDVKTSSAAKGRMTLALHQMKDEQQRGNTIKHEITHLFQKKMDLVANANLELRFYEEGFANWVATKLDPTAYHSIKDYKRTSKMNVGTINIEHPEFKLTFIQYVVGFEAVRAIERERGDEAVLALFREIEQMPIQVVNSQDALPRVNQLFKKHTGHGYAHWIQEGKRVVEREIKLAQVEREIERAQVEREIERAQTEFYIKAKFFLDGYDGFRLPVGSSIEVGGMLHYRLIGNLRPLAGIELGHMIDGGAELLDVKLGLTGMPIKGLWLGFSYSFRLFQYPERDGNLVVWKDLHGFNFFMRTFIAGSFFIESAFSTFFDPDTRGWSNVTSPGLGFVF